MYSFDYQRPATKDGAAAALKGDARYLAGGQSLIQAMKLRLSRSDTLVDLGGIAELKGIKVDGGNVTIGAMTTHHQVRDDALVKEHALLLSKAAAEVADAQIRHRGTFGGALAHADPAGDLKPFSIPRPAG